MSKKIISLQQRVETLMKFAPAVLRSQLAPVLADLLGVLKEQDKRIEYLIRRNGIDCVKAIELNEEPK